jgi:hypothetical protein
MEADPTPSQYSALTQINRANVSTLPRGVDLSDRRRRNYLFNRSLSMK